MGMMPPGMMAMHPFMMMQQMACAAQAAAVAAAAAAHHHAQAAASGAAPAQSDDATDDTANSADIAARRAAKAAEASAAPAPSLAKPAAAAAPATAPATQVCAGAAEPAKPSRKRVADAPAEVDKQQQKRAAVAPATAPAAAAAAGGSAPASASPAGGCLLQNLAMTRTCSGGEEGAGGSPGAMFQASPHSAFRPPQVGSGACVPQWLDLVLVCECYRKLGAVSATAVSCVKGCGRGYINHCCVGSSERFFSPMPSLRTGGQGRELTQLRQQLRRAGARPSGSGLGRPPACVALCGVGPTASLAALAGVCCPPRAHIIV